MSFELTAQQNSTHQLILKGIDYASTLQYEKAIDVFDQIIMIEPENPRGHFLKSATYFWIFSTDMHNEAVGDTLKELSFKAIDAAENRLDQNENDIDALFYLGGAYGTLGRYYGLTQSYLKAYWYGQKGKNYLEEVIEKDSTYYDAYLGLGIYHYLADVLPKFVKVLSFILGVEGDKDQGIRELNLAAQKGRYTRVEALFFLGAIYTYREKEYDKAVKIFNQLLDIYPDNCGALIHLGRCYSYMGQCELALQTFYKILNSGDEKNRLPITSLHYQIGDVQFKMNDIYSAIGSYTIAVESDTSKIGNRRWTYPWAVYKLAECYEMIGKPDRARFYYQQVEEDDNPRVYKRAQERLENPLQDIDIEIIRYENLSDCGENELALQSFQKLYDAIKTNPDSDVKQKIPEIQYNLGKIKCALKNYDEAIIDLNEAIKQSEDNEAYKYWAHYLLGNCYKEKGNIEKALEQYDIAGETDNYDLLFRINKAVHSISAD